MMLQLCYSSLRKIWLYGARILGIVGRALQSSSEKPPCLADEKRVSLQVVHVQEEAVGGNLGCVLAKAPSTQRAQYRLTKDNRYRYYK